MSQLFPAGATPSLILAAGALLVLGIELAAPGRRAAAINTGIVLVSLAAAAVSLWLVGGAALAQPPTPAGAGVGTGVPGPARLALDGLARVATGVVVAGGLVGVAISVPVLDRHEPAGFYALLLLAAAGMGLLASATTLPGLFLGLELLSLSLYVLVAYRRRDPRAQEAAFKYFLLGSLASGVLLFGMALVYGATGTLSLQGSEAPAQGAFRTAAGGFALILVGLALKLALAPFHFWAPDAYEGATLGVTAFMSVATKAAAFAALLRVATAAPPAAHAPLWALAALSMLVGSLGALRQRELRRLMAYSGIANAGYLLIGLPHFTGDGIAAGLFYLGAYALMNLGLFVSASMLAGVRSEYPLDALRGQAASQPLAGWTAAVFLLALVGMPLTGGFVGKVLLVGAAVREGAAWLALVLAVSTAVLAYPYLTLAYSIVAGRPAARGTGVVADGGRGAAVGAAGPRRALALLAALLAVGTVALGIWPEPLLAVARTALSLPG
ncbi:proton-conducting transporter membrane subunit [Carboxydochorda subterranea]|uniref:NADH-quinone oxidoreductase subunit N n=1 Tax=Carboxydichorda subterranea TaxID=3109565 RepID=A0ABZ1C0C9_9FIRM|nr:proton-conducting transporter membrane subunit [Limnochorda sp. L945t]WRP18201.1 proton-conducting transporter membrane subunit [Limnochorda sp. L945t]